MWCQLLKYLLYSPNVGFTKQVIRSTFKEEFYNILVKKITGSHYEKISSPYFKYCNTLLYYEFNNTYSYSELILPHNIFYDYNIFSTEGSNHMLISSIQYGWDNNVGDWSIIYGKDEYNYSEQEVNSVNEIGRKNLTVYPNPFSEYISFNISDYSKSINLKLYDMHGREVLVREIQNNEKISVKNINSGMYFYHLILNGKNLNGKLIKQ